MNGFEGFRVLGSGFGVRGLVTNDDAPGNAGASLHHEPCTNGHEPVAKGRIDGGRGGQ